MEQQIAKLQKQLLGLIKVAKNTKVKVVAAQTRAKTLKKVIKAMKKDKIVLPAKVVLKLKVKAAKKTAHGTKETSKAQG